MSAYGTNSAGFGVPNCTVPELDEADEKNEEKEKEKDEGIKQTEKEFDNMATHVANAFWKQARKQMRFGGVTAQ